MNKFAKVFEVNNYQVLIMISQTDEGEACVSIISRSAKGFTGTLSFSPNEETTVEELFEEVATYEIAAGALKKIIPMFESMDSEEDDIDE